MKISHPVLVEEDGLVKYKVTIESSLGSQILWYSVDKEFGNLLSDHADTAVVAALIPAMKLGEDIEIDGTISEKLYYVLSSAYQGLLKDIIPTLKTIRIKPQSIEIYKTKSTGVMTGFSGGIDAFHTLNRHFYQDHIPNSLRITHLLFNNVGSHSSGGERLFRARYNRLLPLTEKLGLPYVPVNSNLEELYRSVQITFRASSVLRNASVALLFQEGIGKYLFSSGYKYIELNRQPNVTGNLSYWEAIATPFLSTETMEMFSVGHEYTRVEKTLQVSEVEDSYKWLDICSTNKLAGNCGQCKKCLQTQFTLDIAGKLDRYKSAFDLDRYYKIRHNYFPEPLLRDDPFRREIVDFAEAQGFKFPLRAKMLANTPYFLELRDVARWIRDRVKGLKVGEKK
ncbi:MAG: hypothetical protein ACFCBU_04560 [Cyanophyceae cyanobacterium]